MKSADFIQKIKQLRAERGLTQADLADQVEIPFRSYQRIESGDSPLNVEHVISIFKVLQPEFLENLKTTFLDYKYSMPSDRPTSIPTTSNVQTSSFMGRKNFEIEVLKQLFSRSANEKKNNLSEVGYWELDIETQNSFWSEEMWNIYGLDKEKHQNNVNIRPGVSEKDWVLINNAIFELVTTGKTYHNIHQYKRPDGKEILVEGIARRYYLDNGGIVIFGIAEIISSPTANSGVK